MIDKWDKDRGFLRDNVEPILRKAGYEFQCAEVVEEAEPAFVLWYENPTDHSKSSIHILETPVYIDGILTKRKWLRIHIRGRNIKEHKSTSKAEIYEAGGWLYDNHQELIDLSSEISTMLKAYLEG